MLYDTGSRIEVTVPFDNRDHEGQFLRWFYSTGLGFCDDPDKTRFSYSPPTEAVFLSSNARVGLVGCRWQPTRNTGAGGLRNEGLIIAQRAVPGDPKPDYSKVTGMQTEVPGLADWLGIKSAGPTYWHDAKGRLSKAQVTVAAGDGFPVARKMNLRMRTHWTTEPVVDGTSVTAPAVIVTAVSRPRPWNDHLALHHSIRELLELSAWARLGTRRMDVSRSDNPIQVKWCEVVSHEPAFEESSSSHKPTFLFHYATLGRKASAAG
jgi:hypothetical protein